MLNKDILKLIEDSAREILTPLGFDLVDLKYMQSGGNATLRFLVDRTEGGINMGECSDLNRRIGALLEEKDIIGGSYTLEVSSPGLDRALIEPKDFSRALNKNIHIFLKSEHNGKVELEGELVKINNEGIIIINNKNEEDSIKFCEINRAKQVIL
jgi:ribosome maturation factor RimP